MTKITLGIAGTGMVGGALLKYFEQYKDKFQIFPYDKYKTIGSIKDIQECEYVYVCVPSEPREDGSCDTSIVQTILSQLKDGQTAIIKSTIPPGTTNFFQSLFPNLKLLFNPEFLTEVTADQDMNFPDRQIIGYTEKSFTVAKDVMNQLPLAPFERIIPATEAEMTKYYGNTWFSTKVIFANQMYDICEKIGIDYDVVKDCATADKRIDRTHADIFHKGYRGYGGKCLPKDTKAIIKFAKDNGVELKLLKVVEEINAYLNSLSKDGKACDK